MNTQDYSLSILYVDDEPQALKYFEKAFGKFFKIRTCESAKEAFTILEQHSDEIGVLVSDQRMPNQTGVSLLENIRSQYPHIVRILTTAYAELENAIDAVNDGAVFRYITKPWNINELKGVLKNAMDYASVREERDKLLQEKLSTIQRVLIMERTRYLAVIAGALSKTYRNTSSAVRDFVHLANLAKIPISRIKNLINMDLGLCGPIETKKMTEMAMQAAAKATQISTTVNQDVSLSQWIQELLKEIDCNMPFESKCPDQVVAIYPELLKRALIAILSTVQCDTTVGSLIKYEDTVHLSIKLNTGENNGFDALFSILRNASVSEPLDESIFLAFFAIYHHGGHITIEETTTKRFLKIVLPISQDQEDCVEVENYDWIDDVFDILETAGY
jgi:CheY-like chemotaxis protein